MILQILQYTTRRRAGASNALRGALLAGLLLAAASPLTAQHRTAAALPEPTALQLHVLPAYAAAEEARQQQQGVDSAALGAHRGAEAARYEATSGWVMRGFLGGMTLGPIGAGVAYTVANNSDVALTPQQRALLLQEGGVEYAAGYQRAYAETLLARRKRSALTGGALGTAALAATVTAIWAVYYYY
jgi:hypothetical protein